MKDLLNRIKSHWKCCLLICAILFFKICFLVPFVGDWRYLLAFLMEMLVLLCVSLGGKSRLLRIFLLIPIGIEAAQYASLYSTGHYVIPLTLLNMGNAHVIGNQLYVVSAIILLFILLSYINIFLAGKLNIFNRKWAIFSLLGYISLSILMLIAYNHQDTSKKYPFPIENMAHVSIKVLKILSAVPTSEYSEFFKKKIYQTILKIKLFPAILRIIM